MKILMMTLIAGALFAQQARTPITDKKERYELYELMSTTQDNFNDLKKKETDVKAKLDASPLGKELAEIQKQETDMVANFNKELNDHLDKHGAKGCSLTGDLKYTNCPATPAK